MDFSAQVVLENNRARLRPLELTDFEALKAVAFDADIWKYTLTRGDDAVSLAAYLRQAVEAREQGLRYPFAIIDRETGELAGSTSYYNVAEADQRLSIGYTWVGRKFQRSGLNRACKHLLLCHAFGQLDCERVELETDSRNHKSRTAMARMGATEEGTLRSHRLTQGGVRRDTVIFSIIRPEWPALRNSTFKEFEARG
ncbi:GNAT family N-acetyltransferase [Microvirga sp. STS02]|uniref:GNAT family N-acetyltransferase n=1 Tax=Hymenobacter negativus TaxID=2795026 RepID=UPI0018DEB6A2|nr:MULTISPECIES: GNAT family protein [Bacteria]MBH8570365.1 GNAT family N-acetyltransferase [Hymenobacter negativus]MBR7210104.1 GNAT family N-acetyltransferase [Microvirga sp. STS02]